MLYTEDFCVHRYVRFSEIRSHTERVLYSYKFSRDVNFAQMVIHKIFTLEISLVFVNGETDSRLH